MERPAQASRDLRVGHRAQQREPLGIPVRRRGIRQAELLALLPNALDSASGPTCDLGIRQLAEQRDLLGGPGVLADDTAKMPRLVVREGQPALGVPLLIGPFLLFDRLSTVSGSSTHEAI
jgi:hypothetical protein